MLVFSRFLRYFTEVARQGSIRKASERLNVAASAINRQILQAEETLGVPLFERLPAGLKPTAAGEMLLNAAGLWRRDFDRLREQVADLKGIRRGHVRIAVIDALSKGVVPEVVQKVRSEYPGIQFTLEVLDNGEVMRRIAEDNVDFGILLNPQTSRDIRVQAHLESSLGFITRPDHDFVDKKELRFNRCMGQTMIVPVEPLALAQQVRALVSATGVEMDVAVYSDNIQMIKSLVADGVGVGLLSWLDVMEEVKKRQLCFTRISDPIITPLNLCLCVGRSRQLSQAANLLLHRLEIAFDESRAEPGDPPPPAAPAPGPKARRRRR
jgi:DNA-binding transcriptional LysR family regulator